MAQAVAKGVCHAGSNVLDLGLVGTEEVYAAVSSFNAEAGIEVTASHNPIEYNGMKIIKYGSQPLSDKEFSCIKHLAEQNNFNQPLTLGLLIDKKIDARVNYINKVISFIDLES